jgi:hypothetical protein
MVSAAQRLLDISLAAMQLQPVDPEQSLTRSTAGPKHMLAPNCGPAWPRQPRSYSVPNVTWVHNVPDRLRSYREPVHRDGHGPLAPLLSAPETACPAQQRAVRDDEDYPL